MKAFPEYQPTESYLRVATARPEVCVADVATNVDRIIELYTQAVAQDVSLVTFPELSITGYSVGDLVNQNSLLAQARYGLAALAESTAGQPAAMIVGLPLQVGNALYNCAAVLAGGKVQGIVPKVNLPNDNEFYEQRWFASGKDASVDIDLDGKTVHFGTDQLFDIGGVPCGIEICEDLWVNDSPHIQLAKQGALLVANPSASPEQVGKSTDRHDLVRITSYKTIGAYMYASCDPTESTAEVVMGGHQMIMSNGKVAAETKPFEKRPLLVADIDIEHLQRDRRAKRFANIFGTTLVKTGIERQQTGLLFKPERHPFLPANEPTEARFERMDAILNIQANALVSRMRATRHDKVVIGLSGGLDSTLALLAAHRAATMLGYDPYDMIHTLTMPGPASSDETQDDAQLLAKQLGVRNMVIPIGELSFLELKAIQHNGTDQDVTYENVQARTRTSLQFNYANRHKGMMVLGTGDLTEIILGWCTYNGDQQSHYHINGSIPKTLVRALVAHSATLPQYAEARENLLRHTTRIISPELTSTGKQGISQATEDLIGPLDLHEFFMTGTFRHGDRPAKIRYLAAIAFEGTYDKATIAKWSDFFYGKFPRSQFKRNNMPDSPKVGPISASPRGDMRLPPDLQNNAVWSAA